MCLMPNATVLQLPGTPLFQRTDSRKPESISFFNQTRMGRTLKRSATSATGMFLHVLAFNCLLYTIVPCDSIPSSYKLES